MAAQAPLQLVFGTVEEAGRARRRVDALESFRPASAACRELLAALPLGLPAGAACLELPVLHSSKGMGRGAAERAGYGYLLEEDGAEKDCSAPGTIRGDEKTASGRALISREERRIR